MPTLVKYHGSKWQVAKQIISYFRQHKTYVEPFGGSAAVLLSKPPVLSEVYNDLNSDLINVFQIVRNQPAELAAALSMTLYSRDELMATLALDGDADPVERARRFIVRSRMAYSSTSVNDLTSNTLKSHINSRDHCSQAATWAKLPDEVFWLRDRLSRTIIEHTDALDLIPRYDKPNTLFYLDPPYLASVRGAKSNRVGYEHDFSEEQHRALLDAALQCKAMVVISGYDSALYNETLDAWHRVEFPARSEGKTPRTEVLWMNYKPHYTLFDHETSR